MKSPHPLLSLARVLTSLLPLLLLALQPARAAMVDAAEAVRLTAVPQVHPSDPYRFLRNGEVWYPAGYYLGLHTLFMQQNVDSGYHEDLLDALAADGIDLMRVILTFNMAYESQTAGQDFLIHPYNRSGTCCTNFHGTGGPAFNRFNLNSFNPAFFSHWNEVVSYAASRGIVVQVAFYEAGHAHSYMSSGHEPPIQVSGRFYDYFEGGNNANGIHVPDEASWYDNSAVRTKQSAFITEAVRTLCHHDNVIWELANEPRHSAFETWKTVMASAVRSAETAEGCESHLIMPLDLPEHRDVGNHCVPLAGSTDQDFFGLHTSLTNLYTVAPTGINQPLIADNDCSFFPSTAEHDRRKAWTSLVSGAHPSLFRYFSPISPNLNDAAFRDGRRWVGYVGDFVRDLDVDLLFMRPHDDLLTGVSGTVWALANPGMEYVLYYWRGGTATVSGLPASHEAKWFNPRTGVATTATPVSAGRFEAPDANDWVLRVRALPPPAPTGVQASDGTFPDRIRITWNAAPSATRYEVYRCGPSPTGTNCSPFKLIGLTSSLAFDDPGILGSSEYYAVKASNDAGRSPFSAHDPGYSSSGAVVSDYFNRAIGKNAGDPLNGTRTEVGNRTWTATSGTGLAIDQVSNLNATNSYTAGVAFDPNSFPTQRWATVEAKIDPAGSHWIGLGFSLSATGGYWGHGQVWAYLWSTGRIVVGANGTNHVLYASGVPAPGYQPGLNHLKLEYDRIDHTVRVWLNGVLQPLTTSDLDAFGFTPNVLYAGFHAYNGGGYGGSGAVKVDEFVVRVGGSAPPQTITVPANADTYVLQSSPTTNYGTSSWLYVRSGDTGGALRSFVRFTVPPLSGTIQSARLKLRTSTTTILEAGFYRMNDMSWSENTLNWDNHLAPPTTYTFLRSETNLAPNTFHTFDVTGAVTGSGQVTIGIASSGDVPGQRFYSRSTAYPPVLEITYQP